MKWADHVTRWAPEFDPSSEWHDPGTFTCFSGNCLDYAINRLPNQFTDPPALRIRPADTAADIRRGLRKLGLRQVPRWSLWSPIGRMWCRGEGHLVAVAFGPDTVPLRVPPTDYHLYRLDRSGRWSHKPGDKAALDVDASGARILDPRSADRDEYPDFLGYWWVCHR